MVSRQQIKPSIQFHALCGCLQQSIFFWHTHWVINSRQSLYELCLIIFAFTDGIDGKQARRTGTSGPLGELFDHGLDSYSAVLIPIYMFSLFGRIDLSPLHMHFVIWNVFLNFYLTHFEKYNTGVMFLPWAYDFTMWVSQ